MQEALQMRFLKGRKNAIDELAKMVKEEDPEKVEPKTEKDSE